MANLPVLLRFTRSSRGASAAPRARYCSRPRVRVVAPADMRAASGERGLGLVRSLGCQRLSVGVAIGTHRFGANSLNAIKILANFLIAIDSTCHRYKKNSFNTI